MISLPFLLFARIVLSPVDILAAGASKQARTGATALDGEDPQDDSDPAEIARHRQRAHLPKRRPRSAPG